MDGDGEARALPDAGDFHGWLGPDGRCLVVKTPGGTCYLDREVDGHKVHLRVGAPPAISVATSLAVGRWRGWLREGALIDE